MNKDRFNFRIAVFERCNTDEWEFTKFIEKTDKFGVSTNGNVIQENVQGYIIHLTREKTPKNIYRTMEALQCTGLKDKNGKLIYENDIVKFYVDNDEIISVLIWDNDESRFYLNTTDYFKDKYVTDYEITKQEKYEVIGNIYENKNLLERM